jgi:hypothetical protein
MDQPRSGVGNINRLEYRPLEGFYIYNNPLQFHCNLRPTLIQVLS